MRRTTSGMSADSKGTDGTSCPLFDSGYLIKG